ncbi:50S ribosomal protein L22 [Candidatus Woesearchaeota archaeon]|nr:50S ribosomal protein L22 [Candidatus Woesearchaeota archaeon]
MESKYGFQGFDGEHMVSAIGRNLPISTKQSIEISNFIRGKTALKAKDILARVIKKEIAVPYKRFNADVGHKPGIAAGRYPMKACGEILKVLNNAIANAQFKGMNADDLIIRHLAAQKASGAWHFGRKRRRKMKRSHLELVLEEVAQKKTAKANKKAANPKDAPAQEKTAEIKDDKKSVKEDVEKASDKAEVSKEKDIKTEKSEEKVPVKNADIKKEDKPKDSKETKEKTEDEKPVVAKPKGTASESREETTQGSTNNEKLSNAKKTEGVKVD